MAKPTGKKTHAARSKIRNKHQSKKNSTKNKKKGIKRPKNQTVTIERQSHVQNGIKNGILKTGDNVALDDEDFLDILGPDASVDDIDYLLDNRGNLSFLSKALDRLISLLLHYYFIN